MKKIFLKFWCFTSNKAYCNAYTLKMKNQLQDAAKMNSAVANNIEKLADHWVIRCNSHATVVFIIQFIKKKKKSLALTCPAVRIVSTATLLQMVLLNLYLGITFHIWRRILAMAITAGFEVILIPPMTRRQKIILSYTIF